ncbi:MAG: aminoacetone oxidase family FAD-binding enzyme [Clostridia bacterium]|nr:aminoacetone oxidase family FAD-binding enzyme [Clostridia bacterium]
MEQAADVIVIGGGASGMVAAIAAARCRDRVLILEKAPAMGKKLLATGNGRCNLMNKNPGRYYGDRDFAAQVLGKNPVSTLTTFWRSLGLLLAYDGEGRGYPCTYLASTVADCLKEELRRQGTQAMTGMGVTEIQPLSRAFRVRTSEGAVYNASRVILATGGAAQPKLGGNQEAWPWLEKLGHTLVAGRPSLTPLRTDRRSISGLAGLRVKGEVTLFRQGKALEKERGEMLFTETGVSGICVMQLSRFAQPGDKIRIRLLGNIFEEEAQLLEELIRRRNVYGAEPPENLWRGMLAPKLGYAVCKQAGLALRGEACRDLDEQQLNRLAKTAMGYWVQVEALEGFDRAQVMAGGVRCQELDGQTMASRLWPGLHVTGELTNVDGECGGYNLMYAAMSGLRAGWNGRMEAE